MSCKFDPASSTAPSALRGIVVQHCISRPELHLKNAACSHISSKPYSLTFHGHANMAFAPLQVSNMLNKLHGQPDSYDKKYAAHTSSPELAKSSAGQDIGSVAHSVQVHMVL
jgi:hypothetical protein